MHVFLFSDHVSERDEVELKRRGAELGLLVMGPGCGTAMLGEVGLGFANVVRSGSVGIVAAAGTGAQEAASLLDGAEVGVSQIVGVGGRDLSHAVGGIMFGEAMRMLAADDGTDTLLLVSKPPSREVVQQLGEVDVGGKRVVAAFVGWDGGDAPFEIHPTLDAGAFAAARRRGARCRRAGDAGRRRRSGGTLLGLYSGGSLAHEAVTILEPVLGAIGGNAGHGDDDGHAIFDLGEEEYTQGRPHPMVDLEVRLGMLDGRPRDGLGCVLLDVVIGHGSHADPAGGLAPTRSRCWPRDPGDRARLRHRRRPAGRRPPGGDAARGGRDRRAHQRRRGAAGGRRAWHEDRDAHLLGQAARRGGARGRGLRGARAARPRRRADGARAARRGAVPRDAGAGPDRPALPMDAPFDVRIEGMLEAYSEGLRPLLGGGRYDIVHAQDCLSANAALALRDEGVIEHVIRTVHHVDEFTSPSLIECQDRSIVAPTTCCASRRRGSRACVTSSASSAGLVPTGSTRIASGRRATPPSAPRPPPAGVEDRLVVLTVGGVEPRKGSLTLLEGFARLRETLPYRDPMLLIAGGVTLFDYRHELDRFEARVAGARPDPPRAPARRARARRDRAAVPRRRRVRVPVGQGGLRPGRAGGAGRRAAARRVRHRRLPRLPHRRARARCCTRSATPQALAAALARVAREPALRARLRAGGAEVVAGFGWDASGAAHEAAYERVGSMAR